MTRTTPRALAASAAAVALALALAPRPAAAQRPTVDGVYGRLRADTALSIEAGGGLALAPDGPRGAFLATARARYLDSAGLFLSYGNAPGATRYDALALGVDLRPLVIARIFSDLEHGPRWLDLLVDSVGIEMGLGWVRPGDAWGAGSGFAFVLGTGVDVPLAWREGTGLTLRLGVRWVHAPSWDAQGPGGGVASGESLTFAVSLVGRTMARLGLVRDH